MFFLYRERSAQRKQEAAIIRQSACCHAIRFVSGLAFYNMIAAEIDP